MRYIINIGLAIPNKADSLNPAAVLSTLADLFSVDSAAVHQSATEPTLVVSVHASASRIYADLAKLSTALEQDCIAVYCPQRHTGALVGPKAAQWGAFNLAYFIQG